MGDMDHSVLPLSAWGKGNQFLKKKLSRGDKYQAENFAWGRAISQNINTQSFDSQMHFPVI